MKRSLSSEPPLVSKMIKSKHFKTDISKGESAVKQNRPKIEKSSSPNGKLSVKKTKFKGELKKKKKKLSVTTESAVSNSVSNNQLSTKSKLSKQIDKSNLKSKLSKRPGFPKKKGMLKMKGKDIKPELPSNLIGKDGKPKWNKVKDEKKKLKETRKVSRTGADQYQLSVKAKSIWEKLRRKSHTAEKREALVNDLFLLLKGQIPNVVHSHDMTRVVQWMLKLGSASIRTAICEELCVNTVACLQSKYASHCIKRALRYGCKTDRQQLIKSCYGHFLKLLNHSFAWPVIEVVYSMFASAEQRTQMHREMYGEMHTLLPSDVSAIENVPDNMRPAILGSTKLNLSKLLAKKDLMKSTLLQAILVDFLNSCSEQDRNEILELIHGDILDLLSTKEGSRVALLTVWHGTNKMKKVIVKSVKGKVKEIATSEIGHILLLALFDSIDDTVLVRKAIIPELLEEAVELAKNELGRKVILYLVAHRDPSYFHPQQIEILSKGDTLSSRKKDVKLREQEMLAAVSDSLLQKISEDLGTWFGESSIAMLSLAVMKSGKGACLQTAFEKLVAYILDPNSVIQVEERQVHVIEHSAMHLIFKKLIQQDQVDPDRCKDTFSKVLVANLTAESLNHLLQFNRGCFLLVLLFESKNEEVCKSLRSKISKSMKTFLRQQQTTGSKILLKKLEGK